MNVVIFTQGVSPIVEPILEQHEVSAVVESGPRGGAVKRKTTRLELFCRNRHIPYFWLVKDTRSALVAFLTQYNPEIGVVYSMSQLLPEEIINLFPRGIINAHPSLLPAYRGPNPYFRMFYDGASESGITIHYLDKGEDTGDIILRERIPIEKRFDFSLQKIVTGKLPGMMLAALDRIENGSAERIAQPDVSPTARAVNVTKDNVRELLYNLRLSLNDAAFFYSQTLSMLPLSFLGICRNAGDWQVKGTVQKRIGTTIRAANKILFTRHGFALMHPEGLVLLRLRTSKFKYLLKMLYSFAKMK